MPLRLSEPARRRLVAAGDLSHEADELRTDRADDHRRALVLILVGLLGTYGSLVPDTVGILAFVLATAILLIGMVVRDI